MDTLRVLIALDAVSRLLTCDVGRKSAWDEKEAPSLLSLSFTPRQQHASSHCVRCAGVLRVPPQTPA
jgi:hypothetical protein